MFGEVDTMCLIVDIEVTEAGERWQFFLNIWNDILKKKNYPWNLNVKFSFFLSAQETRKLYMEWTKMEILSGSNFGEGLRYVFVQKFLRQSNIWYYISSLRT